MYCNSKSRHEQKKQLGREKIGGKAKGNEEDLLVDFWDCKCHVWSESSGFQGESWSLWDGEHS